MHSFRSLPTFILISSSNAEGFGRPIVEAVQRGLRAVWNDIPVFPELAPSLRSELSEDKAWA